jgi:hypothetical protein
MTRSRTAEARVLAIDPIHRGFGYVVFEGPEVLVDWGVRNIRGQKNAGSVEAVARLIEHYTADLLVLEDGSAKGCWRRRRVRDLFGELAAARRGVRVRRVSRTKVGKTFAGLGASNKDQIARLIVARFPELSPAFHPSASPGRAKMHAWRSSMRQVSLWRFSKE